MHSGNSVEVNATHHVEVTAMYIQSEDNTWFMWVLCDSVYVRLRGDPDRNLMIHATLMTAVVYAHINYDMMTSSNGNVFRFAGPLCGEFTGHRWIPHKKASDVGLWYFLWSAPE